MKIPLNNIGLKVRQIIFASLFLLLPINVIAADFSIIVHKSFPYESLNQSDLKRIFLGKNRPLNDNLSLTPLDLPSETNIRKDFYKKIIKKTPNQLKAYWMRFVFTGKGHPPEELNDSKKVIEKISSAPGFIGYVKTEVVTEYINSNVKTIRVSD